jgi:molybdenum cofactor biosynthesis enzyme MoaA
MKAGQPFALSAVDLIKLPPTSELFALPDRLPVGYDAASGSFKKAEGCFAVAAFLPPGYTLTHNSSYAEVGRPKKLPLFAYSACALYKGNIYATAVHIDKSLCHDSRFMDMKAVRKGAGEFMRRFARNRLVKHLKVCALVYGCPNAKNFFLGRYEAPLPTSPSCNANCAGCISYQSARSCPVTQPRIKFIPTPEELSEIALFHIKNVKNPIVSFGQGCEGEPLLRASIIEEAIRLIRRHAPEGVINMNTNGSSPEAIGRLFDAGLDSVRVSLNSARKIYYERYYRPRGYSFADVARSIDVAKAKRGFISLNYLTMPGFTDSQEEFAAFRNFLRTHKADMIQWRNLNYDPIIYFKELGLKTRAPDLLGVKEIMAELKKEFPNLKMGYFNPAPSSIRRRG